MLSQRVTRGNTEVVKLLISTEELVLGNGVVPLHSQSWLVILFTRNVPIAVSFGTYEHAISHVRF